MLIRPAEASDAAAIALVHVRSWQSAYRGLVPQEFLDTLSPAERRPVWEHLLAESSWPENGVLVAEVDGRVAGFVRMCPTRDHGEDSANVAEITAIYLEPEAWGTGIGRRLMASAIDTLAQAGYKEATLWVLDSNTRARRFYGSAGWNSDDAVKVDTTRGFPLKEVRYRRMIGGPARDADLP
jgi:GNAT superfamily N-acetyltransferase